MKIGYLGPQGTFSEMAMLSYCENLNAEQVPFSSIPDAIWAVHDQQVQEAVVPVENSLEGTVYTTLDLLAHEVELMIKREIVIPVRQALLGKVPVSLAEIEYVFSHPQGIGQCMRFIRKHMPQAEIKFTNSTSEGAKIAADTPKSVAIGTIRAAQLYDLQVLAENIQDQSYNCTRFLVLAKEDHPPTGDDKTSMLIAVPDTPGSLYAMLGEFASRGINLQKIESRPSRKVLGEYIFFIDVNGHRQDAPVKDAIDTMRAKSYNVKMLGSYPCFRL
jgi:prephenate dehydratase